MSLFFPLSTCRGVFGLGFSTLAAALLFSSFSRALVRASQCENPERKDPEESKKRSRRKIGEKTSPSLLARFFSLLPPPLNGSRQVRSHSASVSRSIACLRAHTRQRWARKNKREQLLAVPLKKESGEGKRKKRREKKICSSFSLPSSPSLSLASLALLSDCLFLSRSASLISLFLSLAIAHSAICAQ